MRFKFIFLILILFPTSLQAAIVSVDNTFIYQDQFSGDFHTRLNRDIVQLEDGANNVVSAQITNQTVAELDMADEINPRIRTSEGAACELVTSGLLPQTSGTLTSNIGTGTAYPRGYRCNKASATSKTYTASKWTFVDLDQNCNFQYSEVAIGAAVPAVATNAIRLARVETSGTAITSVQDLRQLNCAASSFDGIRNGATQPSLGDMLKSYRKRVSSDLGYVVGGQTSWDTVTSFKVRGGSAFFPQNAQFRTASGNTLVPQTNDDPALGTSGLDTGAIAASTTYYIYAVADQPNVASYSISYTTSATAPSGVSNYRKLGKIKTNAASEFSSEDVVDINNTMENELVKAWIQFDGTNVVKIIKSFNVSALADNGVGNYTLTWIVPFASADYVYAGGGQANAGSPAEDLRVGQDNGDTFTGTALQIRTRDSGAAAGDSPVTTVVVVGDREGAGTGGGGVGFG